MRRLLSIVVVLGLLAGHVSSAAESAALLTLLPLQDRAGDSITAAVVGDTLREQLGDRFELVATAALRDALRLERVRDASDIAPEDLARLAGDLNSNMFLSVTVHRVSSAPEPQITLSGWAQRIGDGEPTWFGFRSASGLDFRRSLGRGQIEDLETLAVRATRELLDDLRRTLDEGRPIVPQKIRAYGDGYRVDGLSRERIGTIAVLPFESITDRDSTLAAETMTAAARTALYRQRTTVALPGAVHATLRRRGLYGRGELDPLGRAAIGVASGADTILTGTVEVYEPAVSLDPNPRVVYSMRLIDVESGEILWIGGLDRTAEDRQKSFRRKRTYNAGALAFESMESLVAGMLGPVER